MAPLSILDLPMEIKLKILQQVVFTPNPEEEDLLDIYIEWTPNGGFGVSGDEDPTSLFLVCISFSALAQQIFWSQNRFSILPPEYFFIFRGGGDEHIPTSRYAASYFLSQFRVLQPLPHLRSLDLRLFENREEEEIRSNWFAVLDHAIHQGRLDLDFLSINTTFHDDPDWESMPHDPNQLLSFIKSFINGHVWPLREGGRPISIAKCLCIKFECQSSAADYVNIWYRSLMAVQGLPKKMERCRDPGNRVLTCQFHCEGDEWVEELWIEICVD